ncbi:hypothetical protein KP509_24G046600 [Ceratopteris richardii]|uniref:Cytochrome P450 n=1 Tax=Ceratopteris richardii TaxID=49495 RepID=A0A8T2RW96_CERRI|nr:hypothetical protein KP509_24G046600 [Ceratopteris richardii]
MAVALLLQGIILLAAAAAGWIFLHRIRQRNSKDPKTWPLLGAQLETAFNLYPLHDWIFSFFRNDHRTVKLCLPSENLLFTVDPMNVEHILKANFANYPKGEKSNYVAHDILGDGIFNSDGDVWKKHRKLRDFFTDAFRTDALRLVHILHSAALSDKPIDLQVNEIIGIRFFNAFWQIERALNIGKERSLKQEVSVLNSFTANIIDQKRLELQGNNRSKVHLLSRFMSYNEDHPGTFTDREFRDAVLNFVIAGRDTSAITLSWFIFCICIHPHVADMTKKVLRLKDSTRGYTFEEVAKRMSYDTLGTMHYLRAPLTETLRLYPAVPTDGKVAAGEDTLPDGTQVKRGDRVAYYHYSMGRMEFLWGKDALTYNPDHWLQEGFSNRTLPSSFQHLSFLDAEYTPIEVM